ncbi:MAG: hypothetical protein ACR2JY_04540 [Chloroflexota bacterium]
MAINIYFSDFFEVGPQIIDSYGAFNISLINDIPLFIDPFLLFNSEDSIYRQFHSDIIRYIRFLRDKSTSRNVEPGLLKSWYAFGEVKQSWLGFSRESNRGSGRGLGFATALHANLTTIFSSFGAERVTKGSHIEKLCLIAEGVGRDNISDFTTNLIKGYLLEYTQTFTQQHLRPEFRRMFLVDKVRFNYHTENWERAEFELPTHASEYVILTPKNILTKDDIWISRHDLVHQYERIATALPDEQLRAQVNNFLLKQLTPNPDKKEYLAAVSSTLRAYPSVLEYYIRAKEDDGDRAKTISDAKVAATERQFIAQVTQFVAQNLRGTRFYQVPGTTYEEARERVLFLKDVIENKDGYRLFYLDDQPIKRENDLQLLFRLTWFASVSDVNREVNNGRGPVDFKVSRGSSDKSLVEFKLASNSQLKKNLANQVAVYERASDADRSIKVILYFSPSEFARVTRILEELNLTTDQDIVLIDARDDNKPSASKAG